jgi:long-chain acyl-CoA synthetase
MPNTDTAVTDAFTLPTLLAHRVAHSPDGEACRAFDRIMRRWRSLTWTRAGDRIAHWRNALASMDLPAGTRVSILIPNGLDAMIIDQAALALDIMPVPMHTIDNPGSIVYITKPLRGTRWRLILSKAVANGTTVLPG